MTTTPAFVLTRMSWPEVRSALETVRLAIIPTGSCEQHGPNMTLETDAAICYALAERLAQRLYPHALVAPLLPLGVSPHHYPFMFEELTANGALGDARLATFEFGQIIVETALERTVEFLQSFLQAK